MSIYDLITPEYIKNTYAAGVDLTLADGTPFDESVFTSAIQQSVSLLEMDLGIVFDPYTVKGERHDARLQDKNAFWPFKLDIQPISKVEQIDITLGTYQPVNVPKDWATIVSAEHGQFHLVPTSSTVGSFFFRGGVPLLFGDVFAPYTYVPGYFSIKYKAGFQYEEREVTIPEGSTSFEVLFDEEMVMRPTIYKLDIITANNADGIKVSGVSKEGFTLKIKTPPVGGDLVISYYASTVDPLVFRAVGILSAMLPLNISGDLIAGPGIAQINLGIDGLSQEIHTTASATNAGYGARVTMYYKELKQIMPKLRGKYKTINFGTY